MTRDDFLGIALGFAVLAAVAVLAFGGDWLLAQNDYGNPFAQEARRRGLPFDARTPDEFVNETRDFARDGKAARRTITAVYPVNLLDGRMKIWNGVITKFIVPFGSPALSRTYPCNEGTRFSFNTDAYGFTNPLEAWEIPEMILLGDSFVEGMCQPEGNRIADYLRLTHRVLNLARAGAAPVTQLGILREYGTKFSPKVILWFATDNDFRGIQDELKSPILMRYLEDDAFSQALFENQFYVNGAVYGYASRALGVNVRVPGSAVWRAFHGVWRASQEATAPKPDMRKLSLAFVQTLKAAQRATGEKLILVYLADYRKNAQPKRKEILRIAEQAGIAFIDTTIPMADPEDLHQWGIGHYTPLGNRLVAEAVSRRLVDAAAR